MLSRRYQIWFVSPIVTVILFLACGKSNPVGPGNSIHKPVGMKQLLGGTFQMGQTNPDFDCLGCSYTEQPVHSVTISSFYMDITEVTQADYFALMKVNPSYFTSDSERPVEGVTWFDAVLYCNARSKRDGKDTVYAYTGITGIPGNGCTNLSNLLIDFSKSGYRLPTEAEWEYACRAGSTTDFYWGRNYPPATLGDTLTIDSNAVWPHNSGGTTRPVGSKKPNAWGLYDMSGNVFEWCNDWDGFYSSGAQTNPKGADTSDFRVMRGGSWFDFTRYLRSAARFGESPDLHGASNVGFRCVL